MLWAEAAVAMQPTLFRVVLMQKPSMILSALDVCHFFGIPQFYPPREWGGSHTHSRTRANGGVISTPGSEFDGYARNRTILGKEWENRQTKPFWTSETLQIGLATTILYRMDRKTAHMVHSRAIW